MGEGGERERVRDISSLPPLVSAVLLHLLQIDFDLWYVVGSQIVYVGYVIGQLCSSIIIIIIIIIMLFSIYLSISLSLLSFFKKNLMSLVLLI